MVCHDGIVHVAIVRKRAFDRAGLDGIGCFWRSAIEPVHQCIEDQFLLSGRRWFDRTAVDKDDVLACHASDPDAVPTA